MGCALTLGAACYWMAPRGTPADLTLRIATPLTRAQPSAPALLSAETPEVAPEADPVASAERVAATPAPEEILEPRTGRGRDATARASAPSSAPVPASAGDSGPIIDRQPLQTPSDSPKVEPVSSGHASIESARQMMSAGRWLDARRQLNDLLKTGLKPAEQSEARALLTQVANETVFSRIIMPEDPLFATHVVQPGENLTAIGAKYKVPAEAIMLINGIADARKLRAAQKLKVPQGPFHARISKTDFRLDVFLGDTYVRSYRVGLGSQGGTPEGVWRVKERLENPTYYPPVSATDKRIIAPDDPANPLGEHWIGLEGIEGEAVGRDGYGIHGTIEPDSIGKAESAGCVRMHNEDVAVLFKLMTPGHSRVTISR